MNEGFTVHKSTLHLSPSCQSPVDFPYILSVIIPASVSVCLLYNWRHINPMCQSQVQISGTGTALWSLK